jgi:hypothetical protein
MVWSLFADEFSGTKAQELALEASDARGERLTLGA